MPEQEGVRSEAERKKEVSIDFGFKAFCEVLLVRCPPDEMQLRQIKIYFFKLSSSL